MAHGKRRILKESIKFVCDVEGFIKYMEKDPFYKNKSVSSWLSCGVVGKIFPLRALEELTLKANYSSFDILYKETEKGIFKNVLLNEIIIEVKEGGF